MLSNGLLHVPTAEEVLSGPGVEELSAPRAWHRLPAGLVADLSGRDIPHWLHEPRDSVVHGTWRNHFDDCLLFGYHNLHAIISRERRFDCQEIAHYTHRIDHHMASDPGEGWSTPLFKKGPEGYTVDFSRVDADELVRIQDEVYFASPTEPLNWGMWLLQALPSAVDYVRLGQPGRFLCYAERDWQQNFLQLLGIQPERLVHQELLRSYDCKRIVLQQYSQIDLVPTESDREIFEQLASDCARRFDAAGEKIFISRLSITRQYDSRYRALVNEEELTEALAARGFSIVEPERLPFHAQVAIFRGARTVVGLGGAGMFNVLFCAPGTNVISIESSNAFIDQHASLFAALGHRYGFILGRQDLTDDTFVHKRWSIDVPGAIAALESFL